MTNTERDERVAKIRRWRMMYVWARSNHRADLSRAFSEIDFLLDLYDEHGKRGNLTEHDKTRFLERGFTVVENTRHSLRLIKRDDARQAISIKWDDLSALRELITLALDDEPVVIGRDTSGQNAENAATTMRDACVAKVKVLAESWEHAAMQWHGKAEADSRADFKRINYEERDACLQKRDAANVIANNLESLTPDQVKQEKQK